MIYKPKKNHPTPVGPVVNSLLTKLLDHPRAKAHQLWPMWRQAVGPKLSSHTELVRVRSGILTVRVDSPVWADQLRFLKPDVLCKMQKQPLPLPLQDIVFQQGSLRNQSYDLGPKTIPLLPPPLEDESKRAEDLVAKVADPELKEALAKLIRTFLTAKRLGK